MPRRPRGGPGDTDDEARQAVLAAQAALVRRQGATTGGAAAEAEREAAGQRVRTFWLRWPAEAAPAVAAQFGLDGDAVADVLTRLVRTALVELADAERRPRRR